MANDLSGHTVRVGLLHALTCLALGCATADDTTPSEFESGEAPIDADGSSEPLDGDDDDEPEDEPGEVGSGDGSQDEGGAADAGTPDAGPAPVETPVFPPVTAPNAPPPFPTTGRGSSEGPSCVIHRPATLGESERLHPVLIWGMGTGGFNTYGATFERWAGQGFVVAAATLGDGQGDGTEMLACLDYVCQQYAPHVNCSRVGASGHSQGGGGAIMAGQDPRVITTAPIQPYTEQGFGGFDRASITRQSGAMLLLSGSADTVATPNENQQPVFETTNVPVFWANLVGGNHVITGIDGASRYREITLAWFRLQLMGDEAFRSDFFGPSCKYCADAAWITMRKGID